MNPWDLIGFAASALVFAAFYMKAMVPLRLIAMMSNLAFIVYGLALSLTPIWLLHALLFLLNWYRLMEATGPDVRTDSPDARRRSPQVGRLIERREAR